MIMKKNQNLYLIKKIAPYFKKHKKIFILDLFFALLTTICELVYPILLKYIVDAVALSPELLTLESVFCCAAVFLLVSAIEIIGVKFMTTFGHIMGAKIETQMRKDLFCHLQSLHISYHDNNKIGQLMSRLTNDLFDITEFTHHFPEEFLIISVKILVSFIVLSQFNIYLTLTIYAALPLTVIFAVKYNKKMKKALQQNRVQIGELNSQIEDSLLGIRVIKSFGAEKIEREKFNLNNSKTFKTKQVFYNVLGKFRSVEMIFVNFMHILVIVAGTIFLINGQISPGALMACVTYVSVLIYAVLKILEFTEQFQKGLTGIGRFAEVMETKTELKDCENPVILKDIFGKVEFKNVRFKYSESGENILKGVDILINANENVALVGPSGAGKTTICSLIERFYDISEGKILIDDINIKQIKLSQLHKLVGSVHQNVHLFTGSICDNIKYGDSNATMDMVIEAAKKAGIHDFIESLPEKYETYVGQRGVKLSGGQRQRISIARVFLKNPPILILDEATSSLDSESEKVIQRSLERLSKGRTTITIAHRLTSIKNADRIYVVDGGKVVESGTHDELITKSNVYKKLYKSYIN